jgi:hypothetical protein
MVCQIMCAKSAISAKSHPFSCAGSAVLCRSGLLLSCSPAACLALQKICELSELCELSHPDLLLNSVALVDSMRFSLRENRTARASLA